MVRRALVNFFGSDSRFKVVGVADDATSAARAAVDVQPDVAIIDVRMPGGGAAAAASIAQGAPATKVLALSAHDDRESVLLMLERGAVGYIIKGTNPNDILIAAERAAGGLAVLSPEVAGGVVEIAADHARTQRAQRAEQAAKERRIRRALRGEGVSLLYQPIWDLRTQTIAGFEALSRFSIQPVAPPDVWFAEASDCGLRYQLEVAMAKRAGLIRLPDPISLSINLSPETVVRGGLAEALAEFDLSHTVIEITEHAPITDYDAIARALDRWRGNGLRLSVDDAGAGYASLRHILRLEPDIIKLDLTLVRGIDSSHGQRAMAAGLIAFAESAGAAIVAEGIETTAELEALRTLGVSHGQGFLLTHPLPLDEALASARQSRWPVPNNTSQPTE